MKQLAVLIVAGLLAGGLAACSSNEPSAPPALPAAPAPVEAEGPLQSAWVFARGDGEHPGFFIAIGKSAGKLVPMIVMTPPDDPQAAEKGVQVPLKDVESTDLRVSFRMEPVMEMIAPIRLIIEFDVPLTADVVQGYMGTDPNDAELVHARPEDLAGKRVPTEFRKMPWPKVPTWEERQSPGKTAPQPGPEVKPEPSELRGACGESTTKGKMQFDRERAYVEVTVEGDKLVSWRACEKGVGENAEPRVLLELTELTGTVYSARGIALIDGVRHRYKVLSIRQDDGLHLRCSDLCGEAHVYGEVPQFEGTLLRTKGPKIKPWQGDEKLLSGPGKWIGSCRDTLTTPGKMKFNVRNSRIQIVADGTKLVSCKVIERRPPKEGGERVLIELTELTGTLSSGRGFAVIDGVRHPYRVRGEKKDVVWSIGIGDSCGGKHPSSDTPYFAGDVMFNAEVPPK